MRLFHRKPSREQVTAATLPHCLSYIFGLHKGRKPAKSEMRGYLKCCVRKALLHYGYEYDREEAECFIDFVYSEARKVEQKLRARKLVATTSESPDFVEEFLKDLATGNDFDTPKLVQSQEVFIIC